MLNHKGLIMDIVNKPDHYQLSNGTECIQFTQHMSFSLGNALKYFWRNGSKTGHPRVEDLRKAEWYLLKHQVSPCQIPQESYSLLLEVLKANYLTLSETYGNTHTELIVLTILATQDNTATTALLSLLSDILKEEYLGDTSASS